MRPLFSGRAGRDRKTESTMRSMTGFGKARVTIPHGTVEAEVRSVNHRYFKFKCVIPDVLSSRVSEIEDLVRQDVRRGAVELTLVVTPPKSASTGYRLNLAALEAYLRQVRRAQARLRLAGDVPLAPLLTLPQVWSDDRSLGGDGAALWSGVKKAAARAVKDLSAARDREGRGILRACLDSLDRMDRTVRTVRDRAPEAVRELQRKLRERVRTLLTDAPARLQEQDLLREVAILADRCDIAEELQRLESHLAELRRQLAGGGEVGRRLEFLAQEILREANTVGVKANDYAVSAAMVDLKAELEKVKEQLENVE
jgi:uncharacterized protein (TIGR00255 family)